MKKLLLILILTMFGATEIVAADQLLHQHQYAEHLYQPIPPEFHKLTDRLSKWNNEAEAELAKLKQSNHPKVVKWRETINGINTENQLEYLKEVNRITNEAVTYHDDYHHYHKDYWAPPYETLTEGGDCEDIALLKAVALHMHGWNIKDNAHVLIGMIDWHGKQTAHAVLQIALGSEENSYVMRSLNNKVMSFDDMDKIMKPRYMISSKSLVVFEEGGNKLAYNLASDMENIQAAAGDKKPEYND